MEKKYQIFISSTYKDLIEARSKVRDAILSMMHFPVGMEMFNAADEEQWEIIQETIDSSDYYVLILGQRYGSVIESGSDAGISYTEKEFRYAREKKIPVLVFIIDDDVAIKPEFIEKDPESIKKLADFKTEAKKDERYSGGLILTNLLERFQNLYISKWIEKASRVDKRRCL